MPRGVKRLSITAGGEARRIERKQPDGRVRLLVEWYGPNGKPRYKSRGYVGVKADEARCAEFLASMNANPVSQDWTVASWALDWANELKKRIGPREGQITKTTHESYTHIVENHIVGTTLGLMPVHKPEAGDVADWASDQLGKVGHKTLRLRVTVLSQVFVGAVRKRLIKANPVVRIMGTLGLKAKPEPVKNLEFEELIALVQKLEELEAGQWADGRSANNRRTKRRLEPLPSFYTIVCSSIGLRCGEGFGLLWTDFTADYKRVHVVRQVARGSKVVSPVKSKKVPERWADVPAFARKALVAERARQRDLAIRASRVPSPWVMGVEPVHANKAKLRLRKALREAGQQSEVQAPFRVTTHTLRHTYASGQADNGVDPRVIQRQMGHSDPATTAIYTRGRAHPAPEAAAKFDLAYKNAEAKARRRKKRLA